MNETKLLNKGRAVNLLKGAATRMAFFFYCMHRALRLKGPLQSAVHSAKFQALKLKEAIVTRAVSDIKDEQHWKRVYVVLRALWPVLKLLRLCDSQKPGMDKLYYLTHMARVALRKSKDNLNDTDLFHFSTARANEEEDLFSDLIATVARRTDA